MSTPEQLVLSPRPRTPERGPYVVRADAFENAMTGLGTSRDKRTHATVGAAKKLNAQTLDDLYAGSDVAARIVDLPAGEMTREWIDIRTGDDEDAGKDMAQRLDDLDAQSKTDEALAWAALYGGAVLLIGADDGQDPSEPLDLKRIRTVQWLTVLDRHSIDVDRLYEDPMAPKFGEPELYRIQSAARVVTASGDAWRNALIHESRVVRFDGPRTPKRRRDMQQGWCDSVLERVWDTVRDFSESYGGVAHLMTDMSQAVIRIHDLANMLASDPDGSEVLKRLQMLDLARSVSRMLPLDAEHESFERSATPLAGVPEILDRLAQRLSQATGIPVTLLMGQAPAGLQATGESDIRFFYDRMKADQERILRPKLGRLLEVLWAAKDGPTAGQEPPEWSLEFRPLWQLSEKEESERRLLDAQADAQWIQAEVLYPEEVAQSRFGGDRYGSEIALDPEIRAEEKARREAQAEREAEQMAALLEGGGQPGQDPGQPPQDPQDPEA